MYHYNYAGLVNEKQKKIEKKSDEAWKFSEIKPDSLLKKIKKLTFSKYTKKIAQQNNCDCIRGC
ncbi:hypothetical protein [Bacillus sp. MRMR6]|uniref:hypothetical protein n=1 Tax=Bacillus sp. MRMR6 TaxID=1928617 RepID=UPI0009529272|nr:hypothetical protein [Bacillus sp. MRMR6]OLS36211.1 hypothetical protein BTR25_18390 [Bacillus sp. MRMR6]